MKIGKLTHAVFLAGVITPSIVFAAPVAHVSNGLDSGEGSLREALENGSTKIVIDAGVTQINILSPLVWESTDSLQIKGSGQVITGDNGSEPLLEISQGADLNLKGLEFVGPGGFDIEHQGGGKGIFVNVPADRTGIVKVILSDVIVRDTGNHGVHVSDCSIGDDCGAGQGGEGDGSDASIFMRLRDVLVDNAGYGKQDADGIRVDDRGLGDIILDANNIVMMNVGGDGIELDEGNAGSVFINVRNALFQDNGAYCSADFVDDPIALDPACNDDGDPDVDDAFDIDEAGPGGIAGNVSSSSLINNYDEGLDFDSEGTGAGNFVTLRFADIYARDNDDEAIKVSEEDDASVFVAMSGLDIGGDVQVEEEDDGNLLVSIYDSIIGDDLKLSESDDGWGLVKLRDTEIADDKDFEDVEEF